jgi:hypothetical protein
MKRSVSAEHACNATTSSASPSARIAARRSARPNRLKAVTWKSGEPSKASSQSS